ncbi:MAG: malate dehydrogenase [Candidatus Saganbacteria bacterium]|nr:malate dehydrogenase [Candidatus Saganbacteria bacterium]
MVIGAGNVGSDLARRILERDLGNVVLIDIIEGLPQGRALDLTHAGAIEGYESKITGSNDYSDIDGSDIVVITSGLTRKPGMSRDDLLLKNAEIVGHVTEKIARYAPSSKILMVANPLDVMTYFAYKKSGFPKNSVFGMAGLLDAARMRAFIAEEVGILKVDVEAMILGSHGDLMVPLPRYTTIEKKPITELLSNERIDRIIKRTVDAGAEIVQLLKTGSAFYAPAAAAADMVEAVIKDLKVVIPACVYLDGEYGLTDVCIGVPVKFGVQGVEEIVELELTLDERIALQKAAASIKENIKKLKI